MILRSFILVATVAGSLSAAQFPAYSQQYFQRLGGAVDALHQVVSDFDTSAAAVGLSRDEALAQMRGSAFVQARRTDMQRAFLRYDDLREDLSLLAGQGPFMRAYHMPHLTDPEIAHGTWEAFQPALPLTAASAIFAATGGVLSALMAAMLARILWPSRRINSLRRGGRINSLSA